MARHIIKKGLNLPITGAPQQVISPGPSVKHVAVVATDFIGMKPKMHCKVGESVRRGQPLFEDRKTAGVTYTAPGTGTITAINRGARRALQSVVITLTEDEGPQSQIDFECFSKTALSDLTTEQVRDLLLESGEWCALRARPFSTVADPTAQPHSIFVNAMDSRPLSASADIIISDREADFQAGLQVVSKLADKVFVCSQDQSSVTLSEETLSVAEHLQLETFSGKHPSGLVGTHIHTLDPVNRKKTVWHIHYQDVIAWGQLFTTGKLDVSRVISLAGPPVKNPRLIQTRVGASTDALVVDQLEEGEVRLISGDVLSGRTAQGEVGGYLGRYDLQLSVLHEDRTRTFMGWLFPGFDKFSTVRTILGGLIPNKTFAFTTTTHGETREMVPIGMYERVMPLDIMPTFLLRSLQTGDLERSEKLGCLELDEEDLGLCSFVCPGKQNYGVDLRKTLDSILREG